MHIDDARVLAGRKGFTLSVRGNAVFVLIDRHLGFPVLNPARPTVEFSIEEAVDYLLASRDRQINPRSDKSW